MTIGTRIKVRRDTAANWVSANPVLLAGECGLETDTHNIKYGDGTTAWNSLPYAQSATFVTQTLTTRSANNSTSIAATANPKWTGKPTP